MAKPICLMIEDSRTQAMYLSKQIDKQGWTVMICMSIDEAQRLHSGRKPQNILLDLYLEETESINELPLIKSTWPGTPVTMMTAGANSSDPLGCLQRARAAGVDFVLKKPFSGETLGDVLQDSKSLMTTGTRRLHVLVVDDSSIVLKIANRYLSSDSIRVSTADTMEGALDRLTYDTVDVVVTDIFMPGMGGIEGIQRIQSKWPELGLVAMSGGMDKQMGFNDALAAAEKIGADRCIPKPFSAEQITASVQAAVAIRGDLSKLKLVA